MTKNTDNQSIYISFGIILLGILFSFGMAYLMMNAGSSNQEVAMEEGEATPEIIDVSVDDDAFIGSEDAPITIVEFSDYQCPFCKSFVEESYPLLKKDYIDTGKVKLVFRDLPLGFHPNAIPAAEAAECVGENGNEAYFAMHDRLFATQSEWSALAQTEAQTFFIAEAKALNYDIQSCLESGKMKAEVMADLEEARSYNYAGTPTFNINGESLVGAVPYANFVEVLERQLAQ